MRIDEPVKTFAELYGIKKLNHIELVQLLMEGLSPEEIAAYYKSEVLTVKNRIRTVLRKVNMDSKSLIMSEIYKITLGGNKQ